MLLITVDLGKLAPCIVCIPLRPSVYPNAPTLFGLCLSHLRPLPHAPSTSICLTSSPHPLLLKDNDLAMNSQQRKCGNFTLSQELEVDSFTPTSQEALCGLTITADVFIKKAGAKVALEAADLMASFINQFERQVFCSRQALAMDFNGTKLDLCIESFEHISLDGAASTSLRGQVLRGQTQITWKKPAGSQTNIVFMGAEGPARNDSLFRSDFNFEQMGIGGLDEQFKKMFRTAFASRIFPGLVKQLGINHIRGMLLYGPPGCGKTLIARQIGKVLNAREPKIINGPEVLDKFVGGSEEKIRLLFADAEKEQAEMGEQSMLHIIIFDEMDAIMKSRGSTNDSTGVSDSIVNQLLSKIDGVDSLNNILIIGMTNRKDMIDEAILRPGRLEIHIEITLPSEEGRIQILNIKTGDMKKSGRISTEVLERLPELAKIAKNYTGAELEGLVRNAASFALSRNIDAQNIKAVDTAAIKVEWNDFMRATDETTPAFGNKDNHELLSYYSNGICQYGPAFDEIYCTMQRLFNQTRQSERTPLLSVMLEGAVSSGKTALAAKLAAESDFPFIRMISPTTMIGHSDSQRCNTLLKVFTDSYKSPVSIIFIDDIERIIEYTPVGHRFSNSVLQTLLVLLRKVPPAPARLLVVGTTSISHLLEDLQLTQAFNITLHVSLMQTTSEYRAVLTQYASGLSLSTIEGIATALDDKPIAIKQFLVILEMVRAEHSADESAITAQDFLACLQTVGF
jgi:vesicle-fusing ATPase